jgi:DNA repair protein RecO (recombination protein O)
LAFERFALILRSVRYGDDDRVVTFFSLEEGLLTGFARGANAAGNRFGAALSPLTFSSLLGRHHTPDSLFRLHKAHVIDPFPGIRNDYDKLVWAGLPVRAVLALLPHHVQEPALFELFLRYLCLLETERSSYALLWIRFSARMLRIMGFGPLAPVCQGCGLDILIGKVRFDPENGRVRCRDCSRMDGEKSREPVCQADSLRILELFSGEDLRKVERVILSGHQEGQILDLIDQIISWHVHHWTFSGALPFLEKTAFPVKTEKSGHLSMS